MEPTEVDEIPLLTHRISEHAVERYRECLDIPEATDGDDKLAFDIDNAVCAALDVGRYKDVLDVERVNRQFTSRVVLIDSPAGRLWAVMRVEQLDDVEVHPDLWVVVTVMSRKMGDRNLALGRWRRVPTPAVAKAR